jgi:hypothetical protein
MLIILCSLDREKEKEIERERERERESERAREKVCVLCVTDKMFDFFSEFRTTLRRTLEHKDFTTQVLMTIVCLHISHFSFRLY